MEQKKMTISDATEKWLQLYSRTNELAQDIYEAYKTDCDGDDNKAEEAFKPVGDFLNDAAAYIMREVKSCIEENLTEGGNII